MATAQPTAEDLFDVDAWATRPALRACVIRRGTGKGRGEVTLVVRANDVDDNIAVEELKKQHPDTDEMELTIHRCLVALLKGSQTDSETLDALPIPAEPILTVGQVHQLRKEIREGQWQLLVSTLVTASLAAVDDEPDAPSSPES